jgi:putative peptide zinc metalloprotease protein
MILVLLTGAALVIRQLGGFVRLLAKARSHGASPWGLAARLLLLSAATVTLLFVVRWHPKLSAPAVVQSASGGEIRAGCPGFVTALSVIPGQSVQAGDPLALLENVEQTGKLRQTEIDATKSRLRRDQFQATENIAGFLAECHNLAGLERKVAELRTYVASLTLKAPRAGIVLGRDLEALTGTWVEPGQLLMLVGDPSEKELVVLAPQNEMEVFQQARTQGRTAFFAARGRSGSHPVQISQASPSATLNVLHFGLITPFGGPLAVRQSQESRPSLANPAAGFELVKPHFELRAVLDPLASRTLTDGETGRITITRSEQLSLGEILGTAAGRWFDRLVDQAKLQ